MKPLILSFFLLLSQLAYSGAIPDERSGFVDVFSNAPTTVHAYELICGGDQNLTSSPLSSSEFKKICEVVKESELCEDVPKEDLTTCESQDQDSIDVVSFGFFWNCIRALGSVFMDMLEFVKAAIFNIVGYAFDSEKRNQINQQLGDLYDGFELYIANEYQHIKDENPEMSDSRAWLSLAGNVMNDGLSFLGDLLKENYAELGCYHQDAREKKACQDVLSIVVPPATFFGMMKYGPKVLKVTVSKIKGAKKVPVKVESVEEIMESQAHLKLTNPKKKIKTRDLNENYWGSEEKIMVTKNGESFPITYSFDSEIPHSTVFKAIYSDPTATAKLTAALRELRVQGPRGLISKNLEPYVISRDELKRVLSKSDKQLDTFVLRRGVDPNKESFDLTDLNASYVDDFMVPILKQYNQDKKINDLVDKAFDEKSVDRFFNKYREITGDIFDRENIPANPTRDQMWIEMVHKSSEDTPKQFRDLMIERYRPMTDQASSHLHVGIPAAIGQDKMGAISQAVEARIILNLAQSTTSPSKLYATSYSTLRPTVKSSERSAGVVRMNYNRFSKPHSAHDLEIRQYGRMEEGMNNIALAGEMATQYERVRVIDMPKLKKIDDPYTSNLTGALTYASRVLKDSSDASLRAKSARLEAMVDKIEDAGEITADHRVEVQALLKEEGILDLLTPDNLMEAK